MPDTVESLIRQAIQTLTVPAAEYCPAIPDAWAILERALVSAKADAKGAGLISHTETVSEPGAAIKVDVIHLTEQGRGCITSKVDSIPAAGKGAGDELEAARYRLLRHSLSGKAGCSHTSMPSITDPFNSMLTYTPDGLDEALDSILAALSPPVEGEKQ